MKRMVAAVLIISVILGVGCASNVGQFPHHSVTQVNLTKGNYKTVKTNVIGKSFGFSLFGFIPLSTPTYTEAMDDLYTNAGIREGKALALANVIQEMSSVYLILFSIPRMVVRADMIEFTDSEGAAEAAAPAQQEKK